MDRERFRLHLCHARRDWKGVPDLGLHSSSQVDMTAILAIRIALAGALCFAGSSGYVPSFAIVELLLELCVSADSTLHAIFPATHISAVLSCFPGRSSTRSCPSSPGPPDTTLRTRGPHVLSPPYACRQRTSCTELSRPGCCAARLSSDFRPNVAREREHTVLSNAER